MEKKKTKHKFLKYGIIAPVAIWLFMFLVLPYVNLFIYSFWKNGPFDVVKEFTLENYIKFFASQGGSKGQYTLLLDLKHIIITFKILYMK